MPGGVRDFGGRACRSGDAGERLAGKGGGAFGGLPGARKTAGHSEDCRTLGGRERGLWELVRVSGAACKRLGGELSGIAGGDGLLAANCRGRRAGCRELGRWEEDRLRVRAWDAWRRFVWQESRWMQGRGCACGVLPVVRESGMKPGGGVPAFVGNRNRESRAYERRKRGGDIRGAGISYEIPAPGWCLLT